MAGDVTEMPPHAIPHDGAAVTYDMATLMRRRQRYGATGNTACDSVAAYTLTLKFAAD